MSNSSRLELARLFWVGPLTVIGSVVCVLLARIPAVALVQPPPGYPPFTWQACTLFTAVLVAVAVLVFALVERLAANPIRTFMIISIIALVLSFVPDVILIRKDVGWLAAFGLMLLHVVAWAVCVSMLTKLSRSGGIIPGVRRDEPAYRRRQSRR